MSGEKLKTEELILDAAEKIFMRDGYSGSRMQEIADLAGINKAMLHYYFRSKDILFEKVFEKKAGSMFPQMELLFEKEMPFDELLCLYVEKYMDLLIANPFLPLFIINTINKTDGADFIKKMPININRKLVERYFMEAEKGTIRQLNPLHFIISVFSMCAFPFMAKPVLKEVANVDDPVFMQLMHGRVSEIQSYIRILLKV